MQHIWNDVEVDPILGKIVGLASMPVELLDVDFLLLSWVIDEITSHQKRALEDYAVDEQGADQTKPCVVTLFALEVDTDLMSIDVPI